MVDQPDRAQPPSNLPVQLTSFVGREQEVAEIAALLGAARLLTLSGPGGTGKTRLALAAARQLNAFADGVWFIELAGVLAADGVVPAIAQVLNVHESEGRTLAVSLAAYLRAKEILLLVDNFEQVLDAALVLHDLLREAPRLSLLLTSRVLLRVEGEREYAVPPLPLPDSSNDPTPEGLVQNPAVQLFVERARAWQRDFALTDENAAAIAGICRRLDGLPLAIELAAARVRLLPPSALLVRLEHRLPLLTGGARSLPARQQTLRNTIAWSWALLAEPEQVLFRRLGVFAGGWTLDAAEEVCAPEHEIDVLEGLAALADQSLVQQTAVSGEPRFTMLATLREFALEQVEVSGEGEALGRRHADYFSTLAEQADATMWRSGRHLADLLQPLDPEMDNLRAALGWALAQGDAALGLRLTGALGPWFSLRMPREGRRWAEQMLALPGAEAPTFGRGGTLFSAAVGAFATDDGPAALAYMEEAAAHFRLLEDLPRLSNALATVGFYLPAVEAPRSLALTEEALVLARTTGERFPIALAEFAVGLVQATRGKDPAAARAHLEEALRLARTLDADWLTMIALATLATIASATGRRAEAAQLWWEVRSLAEACDDHSMVARTCVNLALAAGAEGKLAEATAEWRRALLMVRDQGRTQMQAICLAGLAGLLTGLARPAQAARLLGAATAVWREDDYQAVMRPLYHAAHEPALAAARAALSEEAFAQAWAGGEAMSVEQASAEAATVAAELLAVVAQPALPAHPKATGPYPDGLSAREVEVLRLLAAGRSNREIAAALVIAEGTVERHMSNLYGKIGAHGRADATAYAFRQHLVSDLPA